MNLCIDIGNSRCKYALFHAREMVYDQVVNNPGIRRFSQLLKEYQFDKAIISSTRNLDSKMVKKMKELVSTTILSSSTPVPITNLYETPETLGKDRLAVMVAAYSLFPNQDCLVIDAGTCITLDFMDASGRYHGGNISPGWKMRNKAMHRFTDKLPMVEQRLNEDYLGKSTVKALQNGSFYGTLGELQSFIDRISKRCKNLKVILTGGDGEIFAKHLETKIFVRPSFVLEGLNEILRYNAE